jgi:hypothetical protein
MESKNFHFKKAKTELSAEASERLATEITKLIKNKKIPHLDNEMFYLLLDPFCKELGISVNMSTPAERYASKESWLTSQILSNVKRSRSNIYRPLLMAWLSYYYPSKFQQFCKRYALSYDDYNGIPDVSKSASEVQSSQHVAISERMERLGTILSPLPKTNSATNHQASKVEREQRADEISVAKLPFAEIENDTSETETSKSKHTPLVLAGLALAAFLSWAVWSFFGNNGIVVQPETKTATNDEAVIIIPSQENLAEDVLEEGEVEGDLLQAQPEPEKIVEVPEPPIDPVWDEITDREWSIGKLTTIRKFVQRASLSDLQKAADDGNINAATLLAFAYHFGELGLPHDFSKEREYARPACQEGQARACMLVGVNFSTAEVHGNDNEMAAIFYRRACNLGSGIGCLYTGQRFQSGFDEVKKDKNAALVAYDTACKEGISSACQSAKYIRANPASIMTSEYAWRQSDGRAFTSEGVAVGWYRNGYIVDDNGNIIAKVE